MVRIINTVQGLVSLLLVAIVAMLGGPTWIAGIGMIAPIAMGLFLIYSGMESPKGKAREIIEVLVGFVLGVVLMLLWAFSPDNPTLDSPTPWIFIVAALPSILFNLSYWMGWILIGLDWLIGWAIRACIFLANEEIG